jgi:hypothetical protein
MAFTCDRASSDGALQVHISKHDGNFKPWWDEIRLEVSTPEKTTSVSVNGRPAQFEQSDGKTSIMAEDRGDGIEVSIR